MSPDAVLWEVIKSALQETIRVHGPITHANIGSAIKRIIRNMVEEPQFRQVCPDDLYGKLLADTLPVFHQSEMTLLKKTHAKKIENIQKEVKKQADFQIKKLKEEKHKILEFIRVLNNRIKELESGEKIKQLKCKINSLRLEVSILKYNKENVYKLTEKLAHTLWLADGKPEGKAEEHWFFAEKMAKIMVQCP